MRNSRRYNLWKGRRMDVSQFLELITLFATIGGVMIGFVLFLQGVIYNRVGFITAGYISVAVAVVLMMSAMYLEDNFRPTANFFFGVFIVWSSVYALTLKMKRFSLGLETPKKDDVDESSPVETTAD